MATSPYLSPDVIARIDRLELDARSIVEGHLAGRHRSPTHGFAVEFAQHREYAPGDDIRHLDWKVFARTERYQVKQYEQETNLVGWLVVDASESMKVGTVPRADKSLITKYDVACTLASALGFLLVNQGDSVGFQMYADQLRASGRVAGGITRLRQELLRWFAEGPFSGVSNTGYALRDMGGRLGRRGLVFLFSDLLDDVPELINGLRILRSQRHEVIVFHILDAAELDFPFRHPTLFRGLEDHPEISTDPLSVRESYLSELHKYLTALEEGCRRLEADYVRIRTDDDLGQELAGYLRKRNSR